jgi:hypothetical protein
MNAARRAGTVDKKTYVRDGIAYIPLCDGRGVVRAWAKCDPWELERIAEHRWHLNPKGHAVREIRGPSGSQTVTMGREVLRLPPYGPPRVRHLNHDPLDSRRSNLRISHAWVVDQVEKNRTFSAAVTEHALRLLRNDDETAA